MLRLAVNGEETVIEFPEEDLAVTVPVTRLGENLFRIDAVPFWAKSAGLDDVIEVTRLSENRYRFERVIKPGGWRTFCYCTDSQGLASPKGQLLLEGLEARGVYWECVFGGVLFICVAEDVDFDPGRWVEAIPNRWPQPGGDR